MIKAEVYRKDPNNNILADGISVHDVAHWIENDITYNWTILIEKDGVKTIPGFIPKKGVSKIALALGHWKDETFQEYDVGCGFLRIRNRRLEHCENWLENGHEPQIYIPTHHVHQINYMINNFQRIIDGEVTPKAVKNWEKHINERRRNK